MSGGKNSNKQKNRLVPYGMVSPGYEAIYTGRKSDLEVEQTELITALISDESGHEIRKWPVVSWTWPDQEKDWDEEILHLHTMQQELGALEDATRQIRAHIGSLVPCDSGFPVTVDELLNAIGKGYLDEPSFHNGCWCPAMWWMQKTTQPFQKECMKTIQMVLLTYLAGEPRNNLIRDTQYATTFINRTFEWLGPVQQLQKYQKLMIKRMLLTIDYFVVSSYLDPPFSDASILQRQESMVKDLFDEGGRGALLDQEIAEKAGLPKILPRWKPEYQETLDRIGNDEKRALYETCCAIASGVYTLSDCHHNTFRYIESWIHGIGTGHLRIPSRKSGTENERLGQLLFGYVLGLDKWLVNIPMPFLLLDLGHLDFGFDPKNEILRVYAYLGEERTPVKVWLAGWLWHTLLYSHIGGNPGGLIRHKNLLERADQVGISVREWMDGRLQETPGEK